jgi:hypothetical protein
MKRCLILLALSAAPLAAQEDGFVSLFNGKDLAGWVNVNCAPETWTVKDGLRPSKSHAAQMRCGKDLGRVSSTRAAPRLRGRTVPFRM